MTEEINAGLIFAKLEVLEDGQDEIKENVRECIRHMQTITVDHAALSERVSGVVHRVGQLERNPGKQVNSFRERIPWWGYIMGLLAIVIIGAMFGLRKELLELIAGVPVP